MTYRSPTAREEWEGELFRLLAENVKDYAIFVTDHQGRVLSWNPGAERLLGYSEAEILGQSADVFFTPEDLSRGIPEKEMQQSLEEGRGNDDRWHVRKDGSRFWSSGMMTPLWDEDRQLRGFAKIMRDRTDLKRAADSVKESEGRFRALMDQAPFSIQVLSADGRTLRVNRAWEELWGLSIEHLADYNVLHDPQLEAKGILAQIRKAFAGEAVQIPAIEYDPNETLPNLTKHDDPRRWISAVAYPLKDDAGEVREVILIHLDTTASRRAEEERRASDQRTRMVLESITDAFFAVDGDWRFTYLNPQAERVLNRQPGELLGRVIWDEYPGLVGSEFERAYRRVAAERITLSLTAYYPDHDRWYEVHVYPATVGISVYFRDTTERKRAEAEVARLTQVSDQQRRIYETALSNTADFNYVFDLEGRFVYVNQSLLSLLKRRLGETVGKNFYELNYPPEAAARLHSQIQQVIDSREPLTAEMAFTTATGERQYEYIFVPVLSARGEVEAVAGSTRDITERKRAEEALRDADRRKDEFLATLAHELRNPLAPISNALQILKIPRVDAETVQRSRDMMERQVHHLVRLVDDLLDVSRVMRGKIELRREKVELASVVARAVETAQPLIDAKQHLLEVQLPKESLLIHADPVRLAQVVGNLLTNSAKYTEPHGRLGISAAREGDYALLSVCDNGIGIAPEMIAQVFELFVQAEPAATRSQGGLGIGLTLVKNLVEMHGGAVAVESAGLGQGSTFVVRLPLVANSAESAAMPIVADTTREQPRSASGVRLLVVDDNHDAAQSLAMLLRLQGHEVRVAHEGLTAVEIAREIVPDVIFLDLGMPGLDGYEVARRLRRLPQLTTTTLVALTGWGQQDDRRRTAAAGFDHHLVKPPDPKVIGDLLTDLRRADGR